MVEVDSELLTLEIPAIDQFMELVRLMVAGLGNRMNFTYEDLEDLKLGIEEACAPIIERGIVPNLYLQFEVFSDRLRICLRGLPLSISDKESPVDLIIKATVDKVDWEIEGEKCSLCLTKYLSKIET